MARLRRAPKPAVRVKVIKPPVPLHRRILGRGATELDTIADLRLELERAYGLDQMEYDTYLDCHEALDIREAKAKEALDKATGRYVKPDKVTKINLRTRSHKPIGRYKRWHIKALCVIGFLIIWKILSFKP
ncbi:hypothetical protein QGX13_gp063 [Pseudomonas phage M5.1]|uniref:Uncharacterized protein n=1 Tax=Pseudomonas phage M5.1 TaxID=2873460 RepID=A0AAE8XGR3_9CAUD|nr:hypothetical protein QGX13_gp063 [Pseudomonas phage M5.1]UAV89760.1 hypothetical protein M51_179 [Pseudomonas phage M5.1]